MVQSSTGDSPPLSRHTTTYSLAIRTNRKVISTTDSPADGEIKFWTQITSNSFHLVQGSVNFTNWNFNTISSLSARDIWDGSDDFDKCMRTVCEGVTIPLRTLCQPNATRNLDQFQRWSCEFCWPNQSQHAPAIRSHCLKVGYRSALMLHIAVGLLLGSLAMSLLVWALIIFRRRSHKVKGDREIPEVNNPQEKPYQKLKKPSKRRQRNCNGRVPILPPAQAFFKSKQPSNQVDGNTGDIEFGMAPEPSLCTTRIGTSAVSSSIERDNETVASRKSSASRDVAFAPDTI